MLDDKILKGEVCPYCNCSTILVSGEVIYPESISVEPRLKFLDKKYYMCILNNDHYVGTYSDNITSLGRLADSTLRNWKRMGHSVFDPLYTLHKIFKTRPAAYEWLSIQMNLPAETVHFGMFNIEQCIEAISHCKRIIEEKEGKG